MTLPPGDFEALAGWGGAFAVVVLAAAWRSRGDAARRRAWTWTLVATAFPGAWALVARLPSSLPADVPPAAVAGAASVVGYGAVLWLVGTLVDAGTESWTPPRVAEPRGEDAAPPAPRAEPPPTRPAPKSSLPTIRSAGAVPAGGTRSGGSAPEVERDGLLRVLALGPDFQTSAAAKGLAAAWAGTRDAAVLDGLIGVLRRDDVGREARAEVWIALLTVDDEAPDWDAQVVIRRDFPDGIDADRIDALDAELHPEG